MKATLKVTTSPTVTLLLKSRVLLINIRMEAQFF